MITRIYIFQSVNHEWRWRIMRKGRIVADSGEGYKRRSSCVRSLHRLLESIANMQYKIEGEKANDGS